MSENAPTTSAGGHSLREQIVGLENRFWIVNTMEMFERLAYYGVRAVIAIYMVLPVELGGPEFTHVQKGTIFAWWAALQSLLPMFTGGYADRYGHKKTIVLAILLKVVGYAMMAELQSYPGFFAGCMFLATGTAIFKPAVQGTLAATLKASHASVGWGIFYQLVNIGGFLGPVLAGVLRLMDWKYVFYACAVIVAVNFLWLPFYQDPTEGMEHDEEMSDPLKVLVTSVKGLFAPRVFFFCLVFSGFWVMFNQVFDLSVCLCSVKAV
ncbi:MAG: MFS transporter [Myxococcota bacterium]|nr:MFS transporter [Myxococcota bacterium]